jgi:hypothetical protein
LNPHLPLRRRLYYPGYTTGPCKVLYNNRLLKVCMNKRGVSPIIAVVLFITLAIAIFVVVLSFTRESVEEGFKRGDEAFEGYSNCDEVKFFVENAECGTADNKDEKRQNLAFLYIDMKNEKNINFKDAFVVKFLLNDGETEVSSTLDDTRLNAYEVKPIGIYRPFSDGDFGNTYKPFKSIELIPRVVVGDGFKFCENKKRKIEVLNC